MKAAYRHNVRHVSVLVFSSTWQVDRGHTHASNHTCNKQCVLVFSSVATPFHTRKSHLNLLFLDVSLSNCVCASVLCKHQDSRLLFVYGFFHSLCYLNYTSSDLADVRKWFAIAQQSNELRRYQSTKSIDKVNLWETVARKSKIWLTKVRN